MNNPDDGLFHMPLSDFAIYFAEVNESINVSDFNIARFMVQDDQNEQYGHIRKGIRSHNLFLTSNNDASSEVYI